MENDKLRILSLFRPVFSNIVERGHGQDKNCEKLKEAKLLAGGIRDTRLKIVSCEVNHKSVLALSGVYIFYVSGGL